MVRVKAAYEAPEEGGQASVVIGTGFFTSREGHILTNFSIVNQPDRLWIEHEDIAYTARVIGLAPNANFALLVAETLPENFTYLHLSDSPQLPAIGTMVVRLSMPLEFPPTPDLGLVSGHESRYAQNLFPCAYIRTSIPAGPGDGGAAYLDLNGRLLGMQVGSLPEIGSTYVLPARAALRLRDDLLFSGKVNYGWIGFEIREETSVRNGQRIVLAEILPGTPAAEAGMMEGDVLDTIGDYRIRNIDDLRNAIFYTRAGQFVPCRVLRDGLTFELNVRLGTRPESEPLQVPVPAQSTPEGEASLEGDTIEQDSEQAAANSSSEIIISPGG